MEGDLVLSNELGHQLAINAPTECDLVTRARTGDREAFGELVRLHRARAYGWAKATTLDHHLAEDIVQEAFIRAFLKLSTLTDLTHFVPWLRSIVRNETKMRLRRGGPHGKERPVPDFVRFENTENVDTLSSQAHGFDRLVVQLFHRMDSTETVDDPLQHLVRKEILEDIRLLLQYLSKRERAIFEAYFFDELKPAEIARSFDTTTANVYNHLSRSRQKVQKARVQFYVTAHIEHRKREGRPARNVIDISAIMF